VERLAARDIEAGSPEYGEIGAQALLHEWVALGLSRRGPGLRRSGEVGHTDSVRRAAKGLAAAPKGQHSHIIEARDAVGKRPHVVKAGVDQLGRLPRSLLVHQCHDAVHAVLTTLVAGF